MNTQKQFSALVFGAFALICLPLTLFSCKKRESNKSKTEVTVFAAASLTETLSEIKAIYEKANPGVSIVYNFDSSGTLKTQIVEGAECDLFLSAAPKQMNALKDLSLLDTSTTLNLLENKTALAVPKGNPKNIHSFSDLAALLKQNKVFLAIGNSDVPVGQYTQKIFAYFDIDEKEVAPCLTYGTNVKEVTTQVSASSVDAGIIYATDAFSAHLSVVDTATPEMTGGRVIYPASVLKNAKHSAEAKAFLEFLKGKEATLVFERVGFTSAQ